MWIYWLNNLDMGGGGEPTPVTSYPNPFLATSSADIDPFAEAAVTLNARANGVELAFMRGDLTQGPPPDAEVILAGDVCYESAMAAAIVPWLERAAAAGSVVYLGDPGRTYLPPGLPEVGRYRVHTTRELEPTTQRDVGVYRMGS